MVKLLKQTERVSLKLVAASNNHESVALNHHGSASQIGHIHVHADSMAKQLRDLINNITRKIYPGDREVLQTFAVNIGHLRRWAKKGEHRSIKGEFVSAF